LALVLLVLLRTDLISSWRKATPVNAPDRFVINVQPDQTQAFQDKLSQVGVKDYDWYPMIRGRLVAVNGREVSPQDYTDERAKRLVDREFNLSARATQPEHNAVVKGQWQEGEKDAVSVEVGIAKTLGLNMGDRLRFDVGGVISEGRISSLRKVDWGSMRANFFVIYPVDNLPDVPLSYMAAFKTPDVPAFERNLLQQFPNVTSVDLRASLMQVQRVLDQVIRAVEFLFAFTLMAELVGAHSGSNFYPRRAQTRICHHARLGCDGPLAQSSANGRAHGRRLVGRFLGQLGCSGCGLGFGPICV